jgi:hypothetical protein
MVVVIPALPVLDALPALDALAASSPRSDAGASPESGDFG